MMKLRKFVKIMMKVICLLEKSCYFSEVLAKSQEGHTMDNSLFWFISLDNSGH